MATVTSVPGTLDITPDPLQKQSKVQIRRNNKKGRIEIVTSTDSGNNYKTLLPEVTSKVQSGSIPVVQESGDVEWSVLAAKASTLTGVVSYVNGGTGQSSYAAGDILYANQQGVLSKLPVGSTDQLLTVSNALPAWQDIKLSDAVLSGLMKFKDPVKVATTTTDTYANGAAAGNIPGLSTNTNLPATIDGVAIAVGDRILVKDQATASQNGVYQRSVDTSKYLLKTIAVNASGTGYSVGNSLTITGNVSGDTAPTFSVTSLKVSSFALEVPGTGVQAGTEYTLYGGTSNPPAKYKALTTKLTEIAIESTYSLDNYDTEELRSLFLCGLFNSSGKAMGNGSFKLQFRVVGASKGTFFIKGMVYSPAASVNTAASNGASTLYFKNLTGTDKNVRKNSGLTSVLSAAGTTQIFVKLPTGTIPTIGDIVSIGSSMAINYGAETLADLSTPTLAVSSISQFDAYLVTAITGPETGSVYTITLHAPLTYDVLRNQSISFTAKSLDDSLLRGFVVGDKFTLGLSTTEYTITNVTQSRALSHTIGSDVCKYGALSGSITFTPALPNDVPVNTTIRYIGKAVPGSGYYPIKYRSTALSGSVSPSSDSFPLAIEITVAGVFQYPVTQSFPLLIAGNLEVEFPDGISGNVNLTFSSGATPNQLANNNLKLVPKCGALTGEITNPGVFTVKPDNGKLTDTGGSLGISFSYIVWAVNAVSITNGGVLAADTTAEFETQYVSGGGGSGGSGLTLKDGTYEHLQAVFSRTADADTWTELSGSAFKVTAGTASGGSIYFCDSRSPTGVIGTTAVSFTKIAGITTSSGSTSLANTGSGDNVLQNGAILNDPVIEIKVAQSGGGSFSFGASTNYDSYTLKLPILGAEDTIVARNTYDVLNNKTLIRPFITSINTGPADGYFVSTLPQQTTTLVGTDTTDTLTNKTIESSILTGDTTLSSTSTFTPAAGATLDLSAANVILPTSTLSGFGYKAPVRAATTANITLSGTQTIDNVALAAGDRVLVKNQSTASQNGIYIVSASTWTRSTDLNIWSEVSGAVVVVQEGTLNQDSVWLSTANATGTIGTDSMPWGMIGVDQTGFGLITQVLVGGGDNIKPVWTEATGTGAPVRAGSPTFTGTVVGLTKSMVGLGSVDNTTDAAKPISTATQTALDLKLTSTTAASTYAPLASPTFTGTPSLPTGTTAVTQTVGTSSTTVATTAFVASVTTLSSLTSVGTLTSLAVSGTINNTTITATKPSTAATGTITLSSEGSANTGGYINTSGNSSGPGGYINTANKGGYIDTSGNATNVGGYMNTSSNATNVGGYMNTSSNGNRGGFINTAGNGGSVALPSSSNGGGYILTAGNGGSNGGNINTSGYSGSPVKTGGDINTSGGVANNGGYINTSNNGGYLNTTGNSSAKGGNIDTSSGGGNINTGGINGNIELGISANRTVLKASGVACSNINLPSTNNSVIMCNKDTAINLALVSSFF